VIQRDRVAIFEGVQTMYADLLNHPDADRFDLRSLRSVPRPYMRIVPGGTSQAEPPP
jgi:hypothetical protein